MIVAMVAGYFCVGFLLSFVFNLLTYRFYSVDKWRKQSLARWIQAVFWPAAIPSFVLFFVLLFQFHENCIPRWVFDPIGVACEWVHERFQEGRVSG